MNRLKTQVSQFRNSLGRIMMMNTVASSSANNGEAFMPLEQMYYPQEHQPTQQQPQPQLQHHTEQSLTNMLNAGNARTSFPEKLHGLIIDAENMGFQDIISWQDSGKSFKVHKPQIFQNDVIPKYFKPIKYTSFQRQLSIYGFQRIRTGWNTGGYEHPFFSRENPGLCKHVRRHQKPTAVSHAPTPAPVVHSAQHLHNHHRGAAASIATPLAHDISEEEMFHLNSDFDPLDAALCQQFITGDKMEHHDFEPLPLGSTGIPKISSHGDLLAIEDDQFILDKLKTCFQEEMNGVIQHPLKPQAAPQQQEQDSNKSAFFPAKLHQLLEDAERLHFGHIVSWTDDGRAFQIHDQKEFVSRIMNIYFDQSKFASFRRQLNLYGFNRTRTNNNRNMYFHESFIQGHPKMCEQMYRRCASGTKPVMAYSA